ncbi:MAG: hypothetical protein M1402_03265 [Candidatus Thermoplasmatota archaeon]|nr:hypothetical protein [Candidatus Thermoplasmatota archaeon]MCL5665591.1 hypothetical protein [Candidatus Thermoplasmatota archaeon]
MNGKALISAIVILSLALVSIVPSVTLAATPALQPTPTTLPTMTYYIGNKTYGITDSLWKTFFKDVYDNKTYVTYPWANNSTQYYIVYDLSYTGPNAYGLQILIQMEKIGGASVKNLTIAFNKTKGMASQVSGYSNIGALDAGAYPGFSWSVPKIKPGGVTETDYGILVAIVASIFVLYFVFNRKK